jgi:hypothetical protein
MKNSVLFKRSNKICIDTKWSCVGAVGIVTGYRLDGGGVGPGRGKTFLLFTSSRPIPTSSGMQPASYPMGIGSSFPKGKVARA